MHSLSIRTGITLLLIGSAGILMAQESISPAGGDAIGSGGSSSYTIGQTVYAQNISLDGASSEGVQHPYEISIITGSSHPVFDHIQVSVYPNPTMNGLTLTSGDNSLENGNYQLFTEMGIEIKGSSINGLSTQIDMSDLKQSTYILKISQNHQEIKTFKIIKL